MEHDDDDKTNCGCGTRTGQQSLAKNLKNLKLKEVSRLNGQQHFIDRW